MAIEVLDMKLAFLRMRLIPIQLGVMMEKSWEARAGTAGVSRQTGVTPYARMTQRITKSISAQIPLAK